MGKQNINKYYKIKNKKKEKEGDLLGIDTYQTVIYKFVDHF